MEIDGVIYLTNPPEAPILEGGDRPVFSDEAIEAAAEVLREYELLCPPSSADLLIVRRALNAALSFQLENQMGSQEKTPGPRTRLQFLKFA